MITIQNSTAVFVGTPNGELGFTNAGTWTLPDANYVSTGSLTNYPLGPLRSGAVVSVDAAGAVRIVDGPDLVGSAGLGFATAIGTVGVILLVRSLWRRFTLSTGLGSIE